MAGSLAALLLPIMLHFAMSAGTGGSVLSEGAQAASRAGAGLGAAAPMIALAGAAPRLPLAGIGAAAGNLANLAKALQFWLLAGLAPVAAWLVHHRKLKRPTARGRPGSPEPHAVAAPETLPEAQPEPPPSPLAGPTDTPVRPTPAQGADLAARARFVAMTFAFPEPAPPREGPDGWPLHIGCQPTRFTLTLRHAALRYCLQFCNRGAEPLGPLLIRAELVAVETGIAPDRQAEFAADALPLCHYLDSLPVGDSIELTGELQLPFADITATRLGTAELLVPLMRLSAESAGETAPALSTSACFAIGMPPFSAGGGIQPFRLDSGPGIWRKLTARRLAIVDSA